MPHKVLRIVFAAALVCATAIIVVLPPALDAQSAPARPPITGVAGLAIKTKDLAAARTFYSTTIGLEEAFPVKNPTGGADFTTFKINDRQYVYVAPDLKEENESRLLYVSFETTDARALRTYLAGRGVAVPATVEPDPQGNLSLMVKDPEGNDVEFIQFLPGSVHQRNAGRFLSRRRLSTEALHVGYRIRDAAVMDTFYADILGYRLMWKGGSNETSFRWISMIVPDGNQWLEYMVDTGTPSPRTLGIWNHLAFGTLDQQAVATQVLDRGYPAAATPKIGRDGRWLMDLYDPDLTRVEFMIRQPVETPCCSPMHDVVDGWQRTGTSLAWQSASDVVWRFSFDPAGGKPFFDPVRPVGGPSLTNFKPEDHPWHYGLWFSWKYINGANYWEENRATGRAEGATTWTTPEIVTQPDGRATIAMNVTYTHPSGRIDMRETRRLTIGAPDSSGSYTIDWRSEFVAGTAGAELDRTPMPDEPNGAFNGGYAGLGVRLPSAPLVMSIVTPDGPVTEFTRNRARPNASAVGCNFADNGTTVASMAILSDPANIGERAPWYLINEPAMRFADPAVLAPAVRKMAAGETWVLHYRVIVSRAAWTPTSLGAAVKAWLPAR